MLSYLIFSMESTFKRKSSARKAEQINIIFEVCLKVALTLLFKEFLKFYKQVCLISSIRI